MLSSPWTLFESRLEIAFLISSAEKVTVDKRLSIE